MATENQVEVKETINAEAENKEVDIDIVEAEEKPAKKSKNLAVILAILGVSLTIGGVIIAQVAAAAISGASIALSFSSVIPVIPFLVILILPILMFIVAGGNLLLMLIHIGGLASSILSLVINRKKKEVNIRIDK